jgi:pimeloyl-ACP methyl ester carboxylesterase
MPYAFVQSTRLWYAEAGQGPVILLLHGFPLDSRIWDDVVPLLTHKHRVITLDLRGFGRSDPTPDFSMRQLAFDVAGFITLQKLGPCCVAGLSMGGYVAQELASEQHELISHMILLDTKAESDDTEAKNKRNAMAEMVKEKGATAVADAMLPNTLGNNPQPEVASKLRMIMESQRVETIASACIAMRDRETYLPTLEKLSFPVDIIVGEEDKISSPELMRFIHEKVNYGRMFTIPNAGHLTPMENPQAVATAILKGTENL